MADQDTAHVEADVPAGSDVSVETPATDAPASDTDTAPEPDAGGDEKPNDQSGDTAGA